MSEKGEMDDLEDCNTEPHNRTIIHIDMDYFYAQVEEIRDPSLRTKPMGIQQRNCVVTANYPAREFGIKKMMTLAEAKKLCPHLVLVNGEDLTNYRQMSAKIFEVLQKFTPLVEKLCLDENYLDVTEIVNQRMTGNFNDEIFDVKGFIYPSGGKLDACGCGCAQRLAVGTHLAQEIRDELYKTLGITCCAGISYNKFLAKLVGSMNKPNKQTVLVSTKSVQFMRELGSLSKITGIGQKTEQLLNESDIRTVEELQNCDFNVIKKKFGLESAQRLKDLSFGRDPSSVRTTGKPKSIGLEDSCKPISVRKDVEERFRLLLMRLVSQVSEDGRIPVTIKIIVRKYDAKKKSSHRETKQANVLPSLFKLLHDGQIMLADGAQEKLLKIIMRLFERAVDMAKPFNITLLGLAFSKFQERKFGSSSIANFFIKKSDLEVQSVTSLKSDGTESNSESNAPDEILPSSSAFMQRATNSSPASSSMSMDFESFSDVSDFSEPEVEPSPKKSRLGLLIAKRRCLSSSDTSDIASPSKLRVAELRLNSRDSEKDFGNLPTTTAVPAATSSKSQSNKTTTSQIDSPMKVTDSNATIVSNGRPNSNEDNRMETTITGNLANIPCPSGVDPQVFKELPQEVRNELITSWRNSLATKSNHHGATATPAATTAGRNTLHRYFIRNK